MRRRALFLINKNSRQGKESANDARERLTRHGLSLIEPTTRNKEDFLGALKQQGPNADLLIIAGGDGTLNAAADALIQIKKPVGILPLGTANDLARTLGIPTDLDAACQVVAEGEPRTIDMGCVNGKCFFNVASLGLSVRISQKLSGTSKGRWGVFAYMVASMKAMWGARPFRARIQSGDVAVNVRTLQIAIGNGRHYGGGMTVAEDAQIDDARLDLYSLEVRRWWEVLWLFPALWRGDLASWQKTRTMQGTAFQITTPRRHAINTDGEVTTHTPAVFQLVPRALQILVPRAGSNVV